MVACYLLGLRGAPIWRRSAEMELPSSPVSALHRDELSVRDAHANAQPHAHAHARGHADTRTCTHTGTNLRGRRQNWTPYGHVHRHVRSHVYSYGYRHLHRHGTRHVYRHVCRHVCRHAPMPICADVPSAVHDGSRFTHHASMPGYHASLVCLAIMPV